MQDAAALGVRGTPAFFIYKMANGQPQGEPRPLSGALPFAQFSQVLDQILAQ
jgi:protein-disulfide isomerase